MPMPPLITVVIPCYNQGNYLLDALQSIRASTYQRLEVLVIDDGSTHTSAPTKHLHLPFNNLRFIFQPNRGVSHTRNRGMVEAHGEFIFFLDADDLLAPHYLEHAITRFLIHPELALVAANYRQFRDGETPGDLVMTWQHFNHTEFLDKGGVLISSLFRKELGLLCGGFSNFLNRLAGEDYEFWLSIYELNSHFDFLPEACIFYRQHPGSRNTQYKKRLIARIFCLFKHYRLFLKHPFITLRLPLRLIWISCMQLGRMIIQRLGAPRQVS